MLERLQEVLRDTSRPAVALSGGVDSMTLAVVAGRLDGLDALMCHAVSPAVPPAATERVRRYAAHEGWRLEVLDAGEFDDARYRANPADRCFFCKTNLYGTLAARTGRLLLSGTNLDDLGDWRPGLKAAETHGVRHPYVEAGIDKAGVRAIARGLGLDDLAELPAAPCISSRIETGIRIEAADLGAIDRVETLLRGELGAVTVRCRRRARGFVVELDEAVLAGLDDARRSALQAQVERVLAAGRPVAFLPYRRGSAFLRGAPA